MIIPDSIIIILLIIFFVFALITSAYLIFTYEEPNNAITYFLTGTTLVSLVCLMICCGVNEFTSPEENPTTSTSISTPEQATEDADTVVIDGQTYVLQNDDDGTAMQEEPADTVEVDGHTYVLQNDDDDDFPYLGLLFFVIFLIIPFL